MSRGMVTPILPSIRSRGPAKPSKDQSGQNFRKGISPHLNIRALELSGSSYTSDGRGPGSGNSQTDEPTSGPWHSLPSNKTGWCLSINAETWDSQKMNGENLNVGIRSLPPALHQGVQQKVPRRGQTLEREQVLDKRPGA